MLGSDTTAQSPPSTLFKSLRCPPLASIFDFAIVKPSPTPPVSRFRESSSRRILLENYYLPGDLEAHIGRFVEHYNHQRYHESLKNLTPADVYFGRGQTILRQRERIKRDTIQKRRLQHQSKAA